MSKPVDEKNILIPEHLIKDLLMPSELRMVKQRYQILKLFGEGLTIRAIAKKSGAGTDTVMRVSKAFYTKKELRDFFRKPLVEVNSSKWVFGQVGSKKE